MPPEPTTPASDQGTYNPANSTTKPSGKAPPPGMMEALNKVAGVKQAPPAPEPPPAVTAPLMPDDVKPVEAKRFMAADDQEPAPPPAAKPVEAPAPEAEHKQGGTAQLREAFAKLKADFTTAAAERDMTRKEVVEFRAKAQAYEERIKSLEAAEVRAKELEQKVTQYDERLRVTDYLNHPEFHERFVKPVADAMQAAHALVGEMVVDAEGEPRQATPQDFDVVLRAPNLTEATRRAKELFGADLYQSVINQRQTVLTAERARSQAIKDAGLKSVEWVKTQQAQQVELRSKARTEFDRISQSLAEKYPQLYKPSEGDKEAHAARQSGEELARLILEGQPPEMPQDAYLTNVAKIYHRAASFPMRELAVNRLQAEVETLKAKLAAYEKSTPDAEGRKLSDGSSAAASNDPRSQLRSGLEALANKRR